MYYVNRETRRLINKICNIYSLVLSCMIVVIPSHSSCYFPAPVNISGMRKVATFIGATSVMYVIMQAAIVNSLLPSSLNAKT